MRPVEPHFGGRNGDLESLGDLGVTPAFHVLEDHDGFLPFGKRIEGGFEASPQVQHLAPSFGVYIRSRFGDYFVDHLEGRTVGARRLAAGGEGRVDGDAMQPSGQRRVAPEAGQASPGPDEGLLGYVGGQFGVGHDAEGDAVDTTLMLADQILEGGHVQPVCHRITSKRPVTVVAPSATKRSSSLSPEMSPSIVACWAGRSSDVYRKRAEASGLSPSPAAAATWV